MPFLASGAQNDGTFLHPKSETTSRDEYFLGENLLLLVSAMKR
jgi:hypothetical protein